MTNSGPLGKNDVSAPETCPSESSNTLKSCPVDSGSKGASLVEYCLLGAIIALTVMLAMPFLSQGISSAVVKGGSAVMIRP